MRRVSAKKIPQTQRCPRDLFYSRQTAFKRQLNSCQTAAKQIGENPQKCTFRFSKLYFSFCRLYKVDRKSGPETRNAILRLISENASFTSREMANKLGINRSDVSKHLKKMQDNDIIHREGSQKSGHWVIIRQDTDLA